MFIARQWIRHRTANVNEYSARYSVVKDRFYHPSLSDVRKQSTLNRQGGDDVIDDQVCVGHWWGGWVGWVRVHLVLFGAFSNVSI